MLSIGHTPHSSLGSVLRLAKIWDPGTFLPWARGKRTRYLFSSMRHSRSWLLHSRCPSRLNRVCDSRLRRLCSRLLGSSWCFLVLFALCTSCMGKLFSFCYPSSLSERRGGGPLRIMHRGRCPLASMSLADPP